MKGQSSSPGSLLLEDFEVIDEVLVGPGAWEEGRVAGFHSIAPPQGSPFLSQSRPIEETRKRFSLFLRV